MKGGNLVTIDVLENFKNEIINEIRTALGTKREPKKYLKSKEVRKLLGVSGGKLQTMRNSKVLPFTPIGGVFYYAETDVYDLLEKNKVK